MRIQFDARNRRWSIGVSAGFVLAMAVLVYLNASAALSPQDAEARVRLVLQREVLRRHGASPGAMTLEKAHALARALAGVRAATFRGLETGKLLPDYVLRPHRPTHVVRVEVLEPGGAGTVRYFSLPWDGIDREIGATAWHFSL